jgi:FO synthase
MEHIKETVERIEENRSLGLDGILRKVNGTTGRILGKALSGEEISVGEAEELFNITDPDELSALAITADEIRKEDVGDVVTYVVNRNINFTNICNTYCGFCNFMAPEGDERAYFLSMDEIADKVKEAWDIGATEVCMQGGMHPDIDGNFYIELIKAVKSAVPEMHTHAFSPFEIYYGAETLE